MATDAGTTIARWRCVEELGAGGNGTVWRARPLDGGPDVALKLVRSKNPAAEPYKRFVREIEFLQRLGNYDGVLAIIDAYLPDRPRRDDRPWLVMPVATPITKALDGTKLEVVVEALAVIAHTLARLAAEHQVGHRDIKPGNLYELSGAWLVGDFGLIDIPDVEDLTRSGRPMGTANFTAYEVIIDPKSAASGPADVYSLGKTLWALATGVNWPPLGHQPAESSGHRIADHRPHPKARHLDQLVDRMTRLDPSARPSMQQAAVDLAAWQELAPDPIRLDVADLGARLRSKLAGELAAHDLQQERKELAHAAVRSLQERSRPLNDALLELHPRAQIDFMGDKLTENTLGKRHSHWGKDTAFSWVRCSAIMVGREHSPFGLRMGRAVELLDDGTLLARWMLDVGPVRVMGTEFNEYGRDYEAPVGSVQQEQMLDRFVEELRSRLTEAMRVFVDKSPGAG